MKVKTWKKWILIGLLIILVANAGNFLRLLYPVKYMNYIKIYSAEYQIDPYLIMSIIKAESNFDHEAVSTKNASGLMQIMKPTALWLADRMEMADFDYAKITEPDINIKMGCYYIDYLLGLFDGDVKNALAAYNAGEGNVSQWLADETCSSDGKTLFYVPFPETRRYITRVTNYEKMYRLLYKIRPAVNVQAEETNR